MCEGKEESSSFLQKRTKKLLSGCRGMSHHIARIAEQMRVLPTQNEVV